MKNMHIDAVVNFPFPTPPDRLALKQAEKVLMHLGAITKVTPTPSQLEPAGGQITDLGRTMALFPLSPRFARMLAAGQQHQCLPYVIAMVSAMSVGDPFLHEEAIDINDNSPDDVDEDFSHLFSEGAKVQEMRRVRRKAFFQSQHVRSAGRVVNPVLTGLFQKHASLGDFASDILKTLSVVGAYEYQGRAADFCSNHFVRFKVRKSMVH
jgi:ATP-dependent RNA helicase DHX37/DHR1